MTSAETVAELTRENNSFSKSLPGLQVALDSTSLGEFKTCPRKYYYRIICGWVPRAESVHLKFGIWIHSALEMYDRQRAEGIAHADALAAVVQKSLCDTWDPVLSRPWADGSPEKNRLTLIRTIVWYLDEFGEHDGLRTLQLASGAPAVELSFRFAPGWSVDGEPAMLCGHLDRVVELEEDHFVVDRKTTKQTLSPSYFAQFAPHNQFSFYRAAGEVAFGFQTKGLIVDGIQVGATFSRFQRHLVPAPAGLLEEWLSEAEWWHGVMVDCAASLRWPMNDKSCDKFGGCDFRGVCSRAPAQREALLAMNFDKRMWDPLQVRGDV